jgi:hypothetical protein
MYREKPNNSTYIKFKIINDVSFLYLYQELSTSVARYIIDVIKTLIISDDKVVIVHDG